MANINHEAVLSAAWILMRRAKNAGSPPYGGLGAESIKSPAARENKVKQTPDQEPGAVRFGNAQAHVRESVTRMISAYLNTPTHISSQFHSW